MKRGGLWGLAGLWAVLTGAALPQAAGPQASAAVSADAAAQSARRTLDQDCATCHNARAMAGGLSVADLDPARVGSHADRWEKVVRKLKTGTMPPPGVPRPEPAAAVGLTGWLEAELDRAAPVKPGRPLLRRLNRAEYANAVRDLLDLRVDVRALLPADDAAFGFDNVGDLLVVSPALIERYLDAADRVSALALGDPATAPGADTYHVRGDQSQDRHVEGLPLGTVGGLAVQHTFPLDGEYEFKLSLFRTNLEAIRGLEHPHQIEVAIDGARIFLGTVGGPQDAGGGRDESITDRSDAIDARLTVRVPVKAGPRLVTASFIQKSGAGTNRLRPFVRSNSGTYDATGRPHIETLTLAGPFSPTGPGDTPSRRRVLTCRPSSGGAGDTAPASAGRVAERPDAKQSRQVGPPPRTDPARSGRSSPEITASEDRCATQILSALARRAYRRPAARADVARLLTFYRAGRQKGGFETGIQLAMRRMLASPSFVFRTENDPAGAAPGSAYRLSDLELATRLSFFLWSSIPDETLLSLAERGRLREPAVRAAQVRRMLADARSQGLVDNFAGQWLHLRNLQTISPNSDEFPDFDHDLRTGFRREAELFFESVMHEDRSVMDLMTADYTFVNERLARHYGIPNVYGSRFRRVPVADEARRGLLGKGSILLATSHADRTAPVLRGKWILENLLGTPPPPPPAAVPPLEPPAGAAPKTVRERMEAHRATPACASCHRAMDPIGFAMENLDAVGAWRTRDGGAPIDASGQLTDGTLVNGVVELRQALLRRPEVFVSTLTEKLMIYALGRGLQHQDMPTVRRITREASAKGYRFSAIVGGIVDSPPFLMRTAGPGAQ